MNKYDDTDMKIVGAPAGRQETDATAVLKRVHEQSTNGNIAKASALGVQMVSAFTYQGRDSAPQDVLELLASEEIEPDGEVIHRVKVLTLFTAEYCVEQYLPDPMLSGATMSRIYDILREGYPEFYARISDFMDVSFYCAAVEGDPDDGSVGQTFAMLCGKKGDPGFIRAGERLFTTYRERFRRAINTFVFV